MVFLLCFLYLPPILGQRQSPNQIHLDVVCKYSKLKSRTRHTIMLREKSIHICVGHQDFLLIFVWFACYMCALQIFWAAERPSFVFCLSAVDEFPSFALLFLLLRAGLMTRKLEHDVLLQHQPAQTLVLCSSSPIDCQALRLRWKPRIIFRQSFFFCTWLTSLQTLLWHFALWHCCSSSLFVRPGQIRCLLRAAMLSFRLPVESLFFILV